MKIIIDANCCQFLYPEDLDGKPILLKLLKNKLAMCLSPALRLELAKTKASELYRELALAGKLLEYTDDDLAVEPEELQKCISNDQHIIHLAIVSGCRLLFSKDQDLHTDFTSGDILKDPRGKVYQNRTHVHLLPN